MVIFIILIIIVAILVALMNSNQKSNQITSNKVNSDVNIESIEKSSIEKEEYQKINKYTENDMSAFSKEYFDWENTPTLMNTNNYSINSQKDIAYINEELTKQMSFIKNYCNENGISIPKIASDKLPTKRIGYSLDKEICTFSFTPFTPSGRIKKVNYVVKIETFPGQPEVDFSKMTISELERYNHNAGFDEYPFGSMEFNKEFELIRANYNHWKNHERTAYTIENKDGNYTMKKLVKQKMSDLELGKPERIIVRDNVLI